MNKRRRRTAKARRRDRDSYLVRMRAAHPHLFHCTHATRDYAWDPLRCTMGVYWCTRCGSEVRYRDLYFARTPILGQLVDASGNVIERGPSFYDHVNRIAPRVDVAGRD